MEVQVLDGSDRPREMRVIRSLVKFWVFVALVFVGLGLLFGDGDLSARLTHGANRTAYFGTVLSVVLFGLNYLRARLAGYKVPLAVVQTVQLRVPCGVDAASRASADALHTLASQQPVRREREGTVRLRATTTGSLSSWGENLEVVVTPVGPTESIVQFRSSPWLRPTVVDYGTAARNVKLFIAAMRRGTSRDVSLSEGSNALDSIAPSGT